MLRICKVHRTVECYRFEIGITGELAATENEESPEGEEEEPLPPLQDTGDGNDEDDFPAILGEAYCAGEMEDVPQDLFDLSR